MQKVTNLDRYHIIQKPVLNLRDIMTLCALWGWLQASQTDSRTRGRANRTEQNRQRIDTNRQSHRSYGNRCRIDYQARNELGGKNGNYTRR